MKALKTGLRNLTLLAALGVAMPALLPKEAAARPPTTGCFPWTNGLDSCVICFEGPCYAWACDGGYRGGGCEPIWI